MNDPEQFRRPRLVAVALFLAAFALPFAVAPRARAANPLQFFFPVENDPFTTVDDEVVVRSLFRSGASQPVDWVLYDPGGQVTVSPNAALTSSQVLDALRNALDAWEGGRFSSFEFGNVHLFTSPFVQPPFPTAPGLDGHNFITFRSSILSDPEDAVLGVSIFFMERDLSGGQAGPDDVEAFPVDLNGDGVADVELENRTYRQGEILETDIIFNRGVEYRIWPEDRGDIPSSQLPQLPGSLDIEALGVHAFGRAQGISGSWLVDSSMFPFVLGRDSSFPTDPYNVRTIAFDDELAAGYVHPAFPAGGEIRGSVLDGQFLDNLPPGTVVDPDDPLVMDELFVVQAPVYLGRPASNFPVGAHPDNVGSNRGTIRLIAQVLTGQSLRYPTGFGGVSDLEPASGDDPNIDFEDRGEDLDGDGTLDPGEDLDGDGELDRSTRDIDGTFRFRGLPAASDYTIYIDQSRLSTLFEGELPISHVYNLLNGLEGFDAEFYGGANCVPGTPDAPGEDDPLAFEFLSLAAGGTIQGIEVVTDVRDTTPCPTLTPSPTVSPSPTPSPTPAFGNAASVAGYTIPRLAAANDVVSVAIAMRNEGTTTWTPEGEYKLATIEDPCGLFDPRFNLPEGASVAPGEAHVFGANVSLPSGQATCTVRFRMVKEFLEFFGEEVVATIDVGPSATVDFTTPAGDAKGWRGAVVEGDGAVAATAEGLCMTTPELGDNRMGWVSPERWLELVDNAVHRLRAAATTDQSGTDAIPLWDVTYDNFNASGLGNNYGGQAWFHDNVGGANGIGRPNGRSTFDVYAAPNSVQTPQWRGLLSDGTFGAFDPAVDSSNDMRVVVRVLDYASAGYVAEADAGTVCLNSMRVDRLPIPAIFFGETLYDDPLTSATHAAHTFDQTPAFASIDDAEGVVTYALSVDFDRATLIPARDLDAPNQVYSVASLYPVAWGTNELYQLIARLRMAPGTNGRDPLDVVALGFDAATNELGAIHATTRGNPGNMLRVASPRLESETGGSQRYMAFFSGQNRTRIGLSDFERIRPFVDFLNVPTIAATGTGEHPFQATALEVNRLLAPP